MNFKLKSLFVSIMILIFSIVKIYAIAPTCNNKGSLVGSVKILKKNQEKVNVENITLKYTGKEQNLLDINKYYEKSGVVYYKVGKNGKWSTEIPTRSEVGDYDIYYYVKGDKNHNDLGSENSPMHVIVTIDISTDDWGEKIENDGIINYVSSNGTTSTKIEKNGVIWLKESSGGTSAWYGLDNSEGVFKKGDKFWVRWLSKEDDK